MQPEALHKPVMVKETLALLNVQPNNWYIDGTFGRGGHTREILVLGGNVLAIDCDAEAIAYGEEMFSQEISTDSLRLLRGNFSHLRDLLKNQPQISGMLFDFGTSVDQLTSSKRGFSFQDEGPLDMRMDDNLNVTAQDLLNALSERELAMIFQKFGGEYQAKTIAKAIKKSTTPIQTTKQLAKLIERLKGFGGGRLHPATKVFQALRIAVNDELGSIEQLLNQIPLVVTNTRIVTIAFHEGEDRLAKQTMKEWSESKLGELLTPKALAPSDEEIRINPRSRSAKVRGFEFKKNN